MSRPQDVASADGALIRRTTPADGDGIGDVWLTSWRATFDVPPSHSDDEVRAWLKEHLLPSTESWVAIGDGAVIALMALSDSWIEQLHVTPAWFGRGVGTRLLALAKVRRPDGLELYCFQSNTRARRFYEARGFRAIAFGDGSANEEGQPDIRYEWRPG